MKMNSRIDVMKVSSRAVQVVLGLQNYVNATGLEPSMLALVKMRASQINGCAYCLDMHSKDARAAGETEQRLFLLNAWREAPCYTDRERAALEWTESLTLVSENHVPDEVYQNAREFFSETELVDLAMAVVAINTWNRLSISFRAEPGTYEPPRARTGATRAAQPATATH